MFFLDTLFFRPPQHSTPHSPSQNQNLSQINQPQSSSSKQISNQSQSIFQNLQCALQNQNFYTSGTSYPSQNLSLVNPYDGQLQQFNSNQNFYQSPNPYQTDEYVPQYQYSYPSATSYPSQNVSQISPYEQQPQHEQQPQRFSLNENFYQSPNLYQTDEYVPHYSYPSATSYPSPNISQVNPSNHNQNMPQAFHSHQDFSSNAYPCATSYPSPNISQVNPSNHNQNMPQAFHPHQDFSSNAYPYQSNQVYQVNKSSQQYPDLSSSEVSNPNQKTQIVGTNNISQIKTREGQCTSNLNKPAINIEIVPPSSTTGSFYSNENIIGLPGSIKKKRKPITYRVQTPSKITDNLPRNEQKTTNLNDDSRLLIILDSMKQNIINVDLSKEQIDILKKKSLYIFKDLFPNKMFFKKKSINVPITAMRLMKKHLTFLNLNQKIALIAAYILSVIEEEKISFDEFINQESLKKGSLFKFIDEEKSEVDLNLLKNSITSKNICNFIRTKNSQENFPEIEYHPNNDNNLFKNIIIRDISSTRNGIMTLTKLIGEAYKERIRKKWDPSELYKIIFKKLRKRGPHFSLSSLLGKSKNSRFLNPRNLEIILYLLNEKKIATFPEGCKVLDPFGKFGEGAIGALTNEQITHYFCNVSNEEIKSSIQKIQDRLGDKTKPNKITCISKKTDELLRENFNYSECEDLVDIVFTDLDLKEYLSSRNKQLITKITEWINLLFRPSLLQLDKKLKTNGFFIVSANELKLSTTKFIEEPFIKSCLVSKNSTNYVNVSKIFNTEMAKMKYKYIGCIESVSQTSVPIWIWQKKDTQEVSNSSQIGHYVLQNQSNQKPQVYKSSQQPTDLSSSEASNQNQKNQLVDPNKITQDTAWETYYTSSNLNKPLSVNGEIAPHSSTTGNFYSNENIIGLPGAIKENAKKRKREETGGD